MSDLAFKWAFQNQGVPGPFEGKVHVRGINRKGKH